MPSPKPSVVVDVFRTSDHARGPPTSLAEYAAASTFADNDIDSTLKWAAISVGIIHRQRAFRHPFLEKCNCRFAASDPCNPRYTDHGLQLHSFLGQIIWMQYGPPLLYKPDEEIRSSGKCPVIQPKTLSYLFSREAAGIVLKHEANATICKKVQLLCKKSRNGSR